MSTQSFQVLYPIQISAAFAKNQRKIVVQLWDTGIFDGYYVHWNSLMEIVFKNDTNVLIEYKIEVLLLNNQWIGMFSIKSACFVYNLAGMSTFSNSIELKKKKYSGYMEDKWLSFLTRSMDIYFKLYRKYTIKHQITHDICSGFGLNYIKFPSDRLFHLTDSFRNANNSLKSHSIHSSLIVHFVMLFIYYFFACANFI